MFVVPAQDLEYHGDVLLILYRIAYIALYPRPVRTCVSSCEDAFAHLRGDWKVRYTVAVNVPPISRFP